MASFTHVVLGKALPGRKDEFLAWYENTHLKEVRQLPGVTEARLLVVDQQAGAAEPAYTTIALYEIDVDSPEATLAALLSPPETATITFTDSIDISSVLQFAAHQASAI